MYYNKTTFNPSFNFLCLYHLHKDIWRMPSILDDPGKIIIMAGDFSISKELNF